MSDWIVAAIVVAGGLFTYRKVYVALAEHLRNEFPSIPFSAEDRAMSALGGLLAASVWPVVIVGYAVFRFATPTTPGERREELDRREREIARLERELGIR